MKLAPIVLFTYNRFNELFQTIWHLRRNELADKSDLIVFSDGGKDNADWEKINALRNHIESIRGFKSIRLINRATNRGLARSIVEGVNEMMRYHDRVIVLEDDLVTSPHFLRYMNDALTFYEHEKNVISISGYTYPIKGLPETFLINGADCQGWATWRRGWNLYINNPKFLLECIGKRKLKKEFDFNNSYPYYKMLKRTAKGKMDSWAINWYASAFLENKYTLYPCRTLVRHVGNFNGTHKQNSNWLDGELSQTSINLDPMRCWNNGIREKFEQFLKENRPTWQTKLKTFLM